MASKNKLELTWIGKDQVTKLEPRILIEDAEYSHHAKARHGESDIFDNKLIFGDNLLALKALEQEYTGKVRCIFIDPPYNTGSAFAHYDDGVEHSLWLSLMRDRLEILKKLLSKDGSLWITIDDNEAHYLKVLCDEIFGRNHFIANIVWQKRTSRENRAAIGSAHDHILLYGAMPAVEWKNFRNPFPAKDEGFANPDNDPKGEWRLIPFTAQGFRPNQMYEITTPSGRVVTPSRGRCWGATRESFDRLLSEGRVYFGRQGDGQPAIKKYRGEESGLTPMTWWTAEEFGDNTQAKREILSLFEDDTPFGTPKPEKLIERILHVATNQGDLVLDSFAGSGTTGAVAHKMGRRWIMVELGEHCHTHVIPRLKKVIDGEDAGGVTEAVNWKGGGGFRYYKLAPSLLEKDKWGNWVINKEYDANKFAAAVCKHEGFTYSPSDSDWWAHGYSTETDFIYVTTQTLTEDQLVALSEEVGNARTLLVCCAAYKASAAMLNDKLTNLTIKKMPNALLTRCEWGKDDYSLNIQNLPAFADDDFETATVATKKAASKEADLFDDAE
jgi:adenine-specific DNA-methyltransferase